MTIGKRIKEKRKEKNLTQKQLADKAGVSLMSIQRYERDERQPTVEVLEKISIALDVPVACIIGLGSITQKTSNEFELFKKAEKNISDQNFWYGNTAHAHKIKEDILLNIKDIAKLSNISIEEIFTPEIHEILEPATDCDPPETVLVGGNEFDGIIISHNNNKFKISADEYYKLANRIIENIAINLLATQTYKN